MCRRGSIEVLKRDEDRIDAVLGVFHH